MILSAYLCAKICHQRRGQKTGSDHIKWGIFGVGLALVFHIFKEEKRVRDLLLLTLLMVKGLMSSCMAGPESMTVALLNVVSSLIIICLLDNYSGKKGYGPALVKYGFYAAYPLQFVVICVISASLER